MNNRTNINKLTRCALLIAIAAVLSVFPKFEFLPYGGSITICSMLPIVLISYIFGLKWGFLSGFAFSLIQIFTGFSAAGAVSPLVTIGIVVFDYLVAFTILGIGGIYKGKLGSTAKELVLGSVTALSLRFLSHVVSGYLFFKDYAEWFFGEAGDFGAMILESISGNSLYLLYSFIYNATYMIPEIIFTAIAAALIAGILPKIIKEA